MRATAWIPWLLATPWLLAQEPAAPVAPGFDQNQWNSAIGLAPAGGKYAHRLRGTVRPNGEAVALGITWLKHHQLPDGSWHCEHSRDATVATTSIAMLVMLGDGSTMRAGPWKDPLKKAAAWLRAGQAENGAFAEATGPHLLATLAIAEAYLLSSYKLLLRNAENGLRHAESRRTEDGGWSPSATSTTSDPTLTVWGTAMLGTAADAGLLKEVDWDRRIVAWLGGPRANLAPENGVLGAAVPTVRQAELAFDQAAANALTSYWLAVDDAAVQRRDAALARTRSLTRQWRQDPRNKLSLHEWFCTSHALAQAGDDAALRVIGEALAAAQVADGGDKGSWEPIGVWGEIGGRTWTTAMALLTLEAPYRYAKIIARADRAK